MQTDRPRLDLNPAPARVDLDRPDLGIRRGRTGSCGIAFDYWPPPFANRTDEESIALAGDDDGYAQMLGQFRALHLLYERDPLIDTLMARLAPPWDTRHLSGLCHAGDDALLAFDDSWTALGWSQWWTGRHHADRAIDVIVLHADDHRDLIAPFLTEDGSTSGIGWIDRFTRQPVSLDRPDSVARAIASRAVGIGSFIAPWVHVLRRVDIRHLRPGGEPALHSTLTPGPRVSLVESSSSSRSSAYVATSSLDEWIAGIPAHAHVLLHIDLDYFNDRYAGARPQTRDEPGTLEMIASVQNLCAALASRGLGTRIEHTAIGMSPGFCPSECWELLLWHLRAGLRRAGCPCV